MSLQDVGSIGELIAAIATVATLVYLAIQVRDNSRALTRSNEFAQAASIHRQLLETKDGAKWWSETAPHLYMAEFRSQVDAAMVAASREDEHGMDRRGEVR